MSCATRALWGVASKFELLHLISVSFRLMLPTMIVNLLNTINCIKDDKSLVIISKCCTFIIPLERSCD